jgi:hypothetical protein
MNLERKGRMRTPQEGDWVTVKKTRPSEEEMHCYPGWKDEMDQFLGKTGRVVDIHNGTPQTGYEVEFPRQPETFGNSRWWYLIGWLEEVMTPEEAVKESVGMIEELVGALAARGADGELDELMDRALGVVFKHTPKGKKEGANEEGDG